MNAGEVARLNYTSAMKLIVVTLGITVLLVLAVLDNSAVMFVSASGIGIALLSTRKVTIQKQLVALVVGALVGSIGAEVVHTLYHLLGGETSSGDSGFFFVAAILIGLSNALAGTIVVLLAHAADRRWHSDR